MSETLAQRLYVAYYGRPADPGGLAYWAGRFREVGSSAVAQVLPAFGDSAEFTERFGILTNEQLVNNLYRQMFNRDAEAGGLDFYVGRLNSGASTLASIALQIADGGLGADRTTLANKVAVANTYTRTVRDRDALYRAEDIGSAALILSNVDETQANLAAGNEEARMTAGELPARRPHSENNPVGDYAAAPGRVGVILDGDRDDSRAAFSITGSMHDDIFVIEEFRSVSRLDGGPGIDTLDFSGLAGAGDTSRVTVSLADGTFRYVSREYSGAGAMISNIETVIGTDGDDIIRGGAGDNELFGGRGDDTIQGGGGNNEIDGGAGNDDIRGGAGRDNIRGGAGDDIIRGGAGDDAIDGGAGRDIIRGEAGDDNLSYSNVSAAALAADTLVDGGGGADTIILRYHGDEVGNQIVPDVSHIRNVEWLALHHFPSPDAQMASHALHLSQSAIAAFDYVALGFNFASIAPGLPRFGTLNLSGLEGDGDDARVSVITAANGETTVTYSYRASGRPMSDSISVKADFDDRGPNVFVGTDGNDTFSIGGRLLGGAPLVYWYGGDGDDIFTKTLDSLAAFMGDFSTADDMLRLDIGVAGSFLMPAGKDGAVTANGGLRYLTAARPDPRLETVQPGRLGATRDLPSILERPGAEEDIHSAILGDLQGITNGRPGNLAALGNTSFVRFYMVDPNGAGENGLNALYAARVTAGAAVTDAIAANELAVRLVAYVGNSASDLHVDASSITLV